MHRLAMVALLVLFAWGQAACGQDESGGKDEGLPSGADGSDGADDEEDDDCSGVVPGGPCPREDDFCGFADDCGSEGYSCEDGVWVAVETGCFGDPVPCSEAPQEFDSCDQDPPCDPDGDCRDVLECSGYTWLAYDVCSEEYCPAAAPQQGKACDEEERSCFFDHPCGRRLFLCLDGWWHLTGGAICTDPVACADVPVANDACVAAGEVCEPLVDDLPTLVCDGASSTWQPR